MVFEPKGNYFSPSISHIPFSPPPPPCLFFWFPSFFFLNMSGELFTSPPADASFPLLATGQELPLPCDPPSVFSTFFPLVRVRSPLFLFLASFSSMVVEVPPLPPPPGQPSNPFLWVPFSWGSTTRSQDLFFFFRRPFLLVFFSGFFPSPHFFFLTSPL